MKKTKVIFMGTPDFAVPILEGLIENYQVIGVVSQPDKEVGRKRILTPPPIKAAAEKHNIPVFQPRKIKEDCQSIIDLKPDLIVTCAYGQIIPKVILDLPKHGCINVHASLLPKLRGGAPIHKAIINGYQKTGITIMYMVEKMDAGNIIRQSETIITKEDTLGSLHSRLSEMGKDLLLQTLPDLLDGKIKSIPQNEDEVTYAYNVTREEEHIDFNKSTMEIYNQIRGLNPHPGSYAILDGKIMKIYASKISDSFYTERKNGEISRIYKDSFGISTKDGELLITEIQPEGKKRILVKDYFNGIDGNSLLGKIFE